MSMLEFFLTFCLLSIVGSFAIYGFYTASRGQWELTPDGKYKKTGMIFKYWSLFWEQYRKTKKVYYKGEGVKMKYDLLNKTLPWIANKFTCRIDGFQMKDVSLTGGEVKQVEDVLLCHTDWCKDVLFLSIEEPVYDWPEWVQKPLSSCPTCMAGPYGTIAWLIFLKFQRGVFLWTDEPILAKVCFGVIFLLTLSTLNSWLSKILKF